MWRFLSLPVTTVISKCTLELPQMTVLDLREAHDRFSLISQSPGSLALMVAMIDHISSVCESVSDSEVLLRDSAVLI